MSNLKKAGEGSRTLLVLLLICLALCFGYPLIPTENSNLDLNILAIFLGGFGSAITFFCILVKISNDSNNQSLESSEEED